MSDEGGRVNNFERPHSVMAIWHVTVFAQRETKGGMFRQERRVVTGYGWSASTPEGGYEYRNQSTSDPDEALKQASEAIQALGGTIGSYSVDATGSASPETKHTSTGHDGGEVGTSAKSVESNSEGQS